VCPPFLDRQADSSIGGLVAIRRRAFRAGILVSSSSRRFTRCAPARRSYRNDQPGLLEGVLLDTYLRDRATSAADTLRTWSGGGFTSVDVQFRDRCRAGQLDRVDPVNAADGADSVAQLTIALNAHADKLNRLLFSWMDYVVIARR
jgi:hypothetical protein